MIYSLKIGKLFEEAFYMHGHLGRIVFNTSTHKSSCVNLASNAWYISSHSFLHHSPFYASILRYVQGKIESFHDPISLIQANEGKDLWNVWMSQSLIIKSLQDGDFACIDSHQKENLTRQFAIVQEAESQAEPLLCRKSQPWPSRQYV